MSSPEPPLSTLALALFGGHGNDILIGGFGDDLFRYALGDGTDTIDAGGGSDTLDITGTSGNDTLNVLFNGTVLTGFENGTLAGVENVTADLDGGTDTLSYAGTTAAMAADLGAGTASGFSSLAGIENVIGGDGNDTLTDACRHRQHADGRSG